MTIPHGNGITASRPNQITRSMKRLLRLIALATALAGGGSASAVTIFDANAAFLDNEKPDGFEINPFGPFSAGHSLTLGGFTPFAGPAQHTDSFNGNAPVEGYFIPNNALVPAVIINVDAVPAVTNFGVTMDPGQLLLHPGNTGADAFPGPHSNAVLRFTAPTTGSYTIAGDWESLDSGATTNYILHNGAQLSASTAANSTFNVTHTLLAGETIDFAVSADGSINNDSTGLRATLTLADPPVAGTTYQAGPDLRTFELANNGSPIAPVNGSWRYGTSDSLGSAFTPFAAAEHTDAFAPATNPPAFQGWFVNDGDSVPVVAVNVTGVPQGSCCGTFDPDQIWMHGDPEAASRSYDIVRWISPSSGIIDLTATWEQMHQNPAGVYLLLNGVQIFGGLAAPGAGTTFATQLNVMPGTILDFVVGPNPNPQISHGATSTGFDARITFLNVALPEPATASLLIVGAAAFARRRRLS